MNLTITWSNHKNTNLRYLLLSISVTLFSVLSTFRTANAQCSSPPSITTQPAGATKCEGENHTFSVVASNATAYEWYLDGGLIVNGDAGNGSTVSGQGTPNLTITNLCPTCNAGDYDVVVKGAVGCTDAISNVATLNVTPKTAPPVINSQPINQSRCVGESVTISLATQNVQAGEWRKNGTPITNGTQPDGSTIAGQGTPSLTITNVQNASAGNYDIRLTGFGPCPSPDVISNQATLSVSSPPSITTQPAGATKCEGENHTFSVNAANATAYEWYLDGDLIVNGDAGNGSTVSGQGTPNLTITNLCPTCNAGDYSVRVYDNNGVCSGASELSQNATLVINELPQINTQPVGAIKCEGESITFTVGATNTGSFEWLLDGSPVANGSAGNGSTISGQGTASLTIDNLCSVCNKGDYSVRVFGNGSCSGTFELSQNATLSINEKLNIYSQPKLAQDYCDGEAVELSIGVSGSYNAFEWMRNNETIDGQTGAAYSFTARPELNGSNYQVRIFGACGDLISNATTLNIRNPGTPVVVSDKSATICAGESYTLSVDGCAASAEIRWFESGRLISELPTFIANNKGLYSAQCVLEGCPSPMSEVFAISQFAPITANTSVKNVSCFGRSDGSVEVNNIDGGGFPDYAVTWEHLNNTSAANNSNKVESLSAGIYQFTITSSQGCTTTNSVSVETPAQINFSSTSTDPLCFGENSGSISIQSNGAILPLKYIINGGSEQLSPNSNFDITNLSARDYQININDSNNCPVGNATFSLDQPAKLELSNLIVSAPKGALTTDGMAQVTINGGTVPYTTQWFKDANQINENISIQSLESNGFQTTLSQIGGGLYLLKVTDSKGCSETIRANIIAPEPILISPEIESLKCTGDSTGGITVRVSGGVTSDNNGYDLSWSRENSNFSSGDSSLQNLPAGTYRLRVTDANNISETKIIELKSPPPITLSSVKNLADYCPTSAKGKLEIEVANAKEPLQINWTDNNTINTLNRNNLAAGNYELQVVDANGCADTLSAVIAEEPSTFAGTISYSQPTCNETENAVLKATVTGGRGEYSYQWSGLDASSAMIENFSPSIASTTLTVSDEEGCVVNIGSVELIKPAKRVATLPDSQEVCPSKVFTISGENNWGNTYQWTTPLGVSLTTQNISSDTLGVYQLTVADANGCTASGETKLIALGNVRAFFSSPLEAPVNEEVVFVDLTSPVASEIEWQLPPSATLISQDDFTLKVRFTEIGTFNTRLLATVDGCTFPFERSIIIVEEFDDGDFSPPVGTTQQFDFTILSNPTDQSFVRIKLNQSAFPDSEIILTDQQGQVVFKKSLREVPEQVLSFPLNSIRGGTYILSIKNKDNMLSKRLYIRR